MVTSRSLSLAPADTVTRTTRRWPFTALFPIFSFQWPQCLINIDITCLATISRIYRRACWTTGPLFSHTKRSFTSLYWPVSYIYSRLNTPLDVERTMDIGPRDSKIINRQHLINASELRRVSRKISPEAALYASTCELSYGIRFTLHSPCCATRGVIQHTRGVLLLSKLPANLAFSKVWYRL